MTASPYFLPGWVEFTRRITGLRPLTLHLNQENYPLPAIDAVLYLDQRDRIAMPYTNSYAAIHFSTTSTKQPARLHRQWLEVGDMLVDELRNRGMRHPISIPPDLDDMRVWQWRGFKTTVRYTFLLDLPLDVARLDAAKRKNMVKARNLGFRCERVDALRDVHPCLLDTEARQQFTHNLTAADLDLAAELVPAENLRSYVVYSAEGEAAGAAVVLHVPGTRAIGWLRGAKGQFLRGAAMPLLDEFVFDDLAKAGATGIDLAGANIPSVSNYKMELGGRLVPYYVVEAPAVKGLVLDAAAYLRFRRLRA